MRRRPRTVAISATKSATVLGCCPSLWSSSMASVEARAANSPSVKTRLTAWGALEATAARCLRDAVRIRSADHVRGQPAGRPGGDRLRLLRGEQAKHVGRNRLSVDGL